MQLQYNLASRCKNLTNAPARGTPAGRANFSGPEGRGARDKTDRLIWEEIKRPNGPRNFFPNYIIYPPDGYRTYRAALSCKRDELSDIRGEEEKKDSPRVNLLPFALFSALETSSWSAYRLSRISKIRCERGG